MSDIEKIQTESNLEKEGPQPEKTETPEIKITTFEKLRQFGRKVINVIQKKSQETITQGTEILEQSTKSVGAEPKMIQQTEAEMGTKNQLEETQTEIQELGQKTEKQVEEITNKEIIEEKKEYTIEQQEKVFNLLSERLKEEKGIVTDENLVRITRETAKEFGLKSDIFDNPENRPLVFYRAFKDTGAVKSFLKKDEITLRPFSFAGPGKWSKKEADIPGSYGGENPMLIRIIDVSGKWKDTADDELKGTWNEAMNWEKVVLRKIDERIMDRADIEKQVMLETEKTGKETPQITYIVDKIETEKTNKAKNFEDIANDTSWWNEIQIEAEARFSPSALRGEGENRELNERYLKYFSQTMRLDNNKPETEEARESLKKAKLEICKLANRAINAKDDDLNWTPEICKKVLGNFSKEDWQEFFNITIQAEEEKEKLFEEKSKKIGEKIGEKIRREDYKL